MNTNIIRAALVPLLAMCITNSASARFLFRTESDFAAPPGATRTDIGVEDDGTGRRYTIVYGCDGSMCIYPYVPSPYAHISATTQFFIPANWPDLVDAARTITTPGTDVGIFVVTDHGDTMRYRNPNSEAEFKEYLALWENEPGGGMTNHLSEKGSETLTRGVNEFLTNAYRREIEPADRRIAASFIDRYLNARFPDRHGMPSEDAIDEVAGISKALIANVSTIAIRQMPSPANGQTLIITPAAIGLGGPCRLSDAAGAMVWQGTVDNEQTISMNGLASGIYFIRGEGRALVVAIVR